MGRSRTVRRVLVALLAGAVIAALWASAASAQVQVTPNFSVDPVEEKEKTQIWLIWMAISALVLSVLVLGGLAASYLRFAPKFFGREEVERRPPGYRPPHLARAAARAGVGTTRPAVAQGPGAPTRPVPPEPAAPTPAAAQATAPPAGEPAVQADAVGEAEARAPEARPTAKTAEEVGAEALAPTAAEAPPAPVAPEAPPTPAAERAEAPVAERAPAAATGKAELDQETFDRVLQEQLSKGVDRRVAEGRARAAAVVAARKRSAG